MPEEERGKIFYAKTTTRNLRLDELQQKHWSDDESKEVQ
jgi:hypothetical protein